MVVEKDTGEIDFKLIDLGSSFQFAQIHECLDTTTPEYIPPEILEYIEQKQSMAG